MHPTFQPYRLIKINLLKNLAQTDKTDDTRYDLEQKSNKFSKEIGELNTRIAQIKGKLSG